MYQLLILLILILVSSAIPQKRELPGNNGLYPYIFEYDLCETVYCSRGEECVLNGGIARCQCVSVCPPGRQVCASNGKTYESHCDMHRDACLLSKRLHIIEHNKCPPPLLPENGLLTEIVIQQKQEAIKNDISYTFPKAYTFEESKQLDYSTDTASIVEDQDNVRNNDRSDKTIKDNKQIKSNKQIGNGVVNNIEDLEKNPAKIKTNNNEPILTNTTMLDLSDDYNYKCEAGDIVFLKNNLLLYFHAKYGEFDENADYRDKSHLVDIMMSHMDEDKDGVVSYDDLVRVQSTEELYSKLLPPGCSLTQLISNIDLDGDSLLSQREFFNGFGVAMPFLRNTELVIVHEVYVGNEYQILCTIEPHKDPSLRRVWFRQGRPLADVPQYNFKISKQVLYLTPAKPEHTGNFSCKVQNTEQIHVVIVKDTVTVEIKPSFLLLKTGETGSVECFVKGSAWKVPQIKWKKNQIALNSNSSLLLFESGKPSDTATYTCEVESNKGPLSASTSVVVRNNFHQPEISLRSSKEIYPDLVVFKRGGVHMFSSSDCLTRKIIPSSYVGLDINRPYLCQKSRCTWTDAVVMSSGVIYALLKEERALAVMNIKNATVLQLIQLESGGERLEYNKQTDTVWVVGIAGAQGRTVSLIRDASTTTRKSIVHAMINSEQIDEIFLPPTDSLVQYAYVRFSQSMKLFKLRLTTAETVSQVDLKTHSCFPTNVAFAQSVGIVVVYCNREKGVIGRQLIMDYLSDVVIHVHDDQVIGTPLILPNRSLLMTVNQWTGEVHLQNYVNRDLSMWMSSDLNVPLSDWLVVSSAGVYGYTLHGISPYTDHILTLNLSNDHKSEHTIEETPNFNPQTRGHLLIQSKSRSLYAYVDGGNVSIASSINLIKPNTKCNLDRLDNVQFIKWLES